MSPKTHFEKLQDESKGSGLARDVPVRKQCCPGAARFKDDHGESRKTYEKYIFLIKL